MYFRNYTTEVGLDYGWRSVDTSHMRVATKNVQGCCHTLLGRRSPCYR